MRCDEIRERFVDLLYSEPGTPAASPELKAHIMSCPECRERLDEFMEVRQLLKAWKDEPPLQPVAIPASLASFQGKSTHGKSTPRWGRLVRYGAIAAMVLVTFLALANTEITWNKEGFSFKTHLLPAGNMRGEYYTKVETRDVLRRAVDDTEGRLNEMNYLMMQRLMDTVEQERWMDLRLVKTQARNKN